MIPLNACIEDKKLHNPIYTIQKETIPKTGPGVIFHYNFDSLEHRSNKAEICLHLKIFNSPEGKCEIYSDVEIIDRAEKNKSLRLYQNKHQMNNRYIIKLETPIFEDHEELYVGYWIRFSDNFSFGKGGKLPGGLIGIEKGKPYPAHGNEVTRDSGFSVRSMFYTRGYWNREQDVNRYPQLYTYIYHEDMEGRSGDKTSYRLGGYPLDFLRKSIDSHISRSTTSMAEFFKPGYFIVTRVKMNSYKNNDGLVEVFINGKNVIHNDNYSFSYSKKYGINKATFSFFYGGNINWKPYTSDKDKSYIEIDDIILSTAMIE